MNKSELFEKLSVLVDKLNDYIGSAEWLPVELIYQDYNFYIKAFGLLIWDCDDYYIEAVEEQCYDEIHNLFKPFFNKQLVDLQSDLLNSEGSVDAIEDLIESYRL